MQLKLEPIKANFTDLEPGTVLHWRGPYEHKSVILSKKETRFCITYECFNVDSEKRHSVDAFLIVKGDEPNLWHTQHYYLTDERKTSREVLELYDILTQKETEKANHADEQAKQQAALAEIGRKVWDKHFAGRGFVSLIVAEHHINDCDLQTDYFNSKISDKVILAGSTHKKDLFSEMRKAATLLPETSHMGPGKDIYRPFLAAKENYTGNICVFKDCASPYHEKFYKIDGKLVEFGTEAEAMEYAEKIGLPAPVGNVSVYWKVRKESFENREKYTGGSGYYLAKNSYEGWQVSKTSYNCFDQHGNPSEWVLVALGKRSDHLQTQHTSTLKATAKAKPVAVVPGKIEIIDYSEKACAVVGDTKPIKDELKALGAKFNARLSCGPGWIIPKARKAEFEKFAA